MRISAIGLGWYERKDYPRILDVMSDAHLLPRTYDDWLQQAEGAERGAAASGAIVVRAVIHPDEFVAWCRAEGLEVDAKARMRFANQAAAAVVCWDDPGV